MGRHKNPLVERQALDIFQAHGGILRSADAIKLGIHPRTLYSLRDTGSIEQIQRGLFSLPELPDHTQPDLVTVTTKVPNGVLCLISALFFHHLTTQIPHFVYLAIKQGSKPPKIAYPPVKFSWFIEKFFNLGIEHHELDGISIRCYSKEKTIVDCFKYRNKIGIDVAIEALRKYWFQGNPKLDLLMQYAKILRVEKIIKPYIEAIINESS